MENLNGHAWVADGYKKVSIYRKIKRVEGDYGYYRGRSEQVSYYTEFYYSASYIHMNWGWGLVGVYDDGNTIQTKGDNGWCTYDYWINVSGETKGDTRYGVDKGMITVRKRYHWER